MLAAESITHLELRSAWSVNVADFTDAPAGRVPRGDRRPRESGSRRSAPPSARSRSARRSNRNWSGCAASRTSPPSSAPRWCASSRSTCRPASRRSATGRRSSTGWGRWRGSREERGVILAHENEKEIYGDVPAPVRRPDRQRGLPRAAGHLRRRQLRAVRGAAVHRRLPAAPAAPGVPAGQGRASGGPARSRPPARATGRCARRWPPCATRASPGTCRSSRTWTSPHWKAPPCHDAHPERTSHYLAGYNLASRYSWWHLSRPRLIGYSDLAK